jgi:uncharacterized RDD family membrane protein YckC
VNDAPGAADSRAAYAGFWRRLAAYVVDYFVVFAGSAALALVASVAGFLPDGAPQWSAIVLAGYFLYCTLLESSRSQATLGKRALGLTVTNVRGERVGFARAALRFVAKLLSVFTLGFGFVLIAVTPRRQALHDLIAGTVVVDGAKSSQPVWLVSALACVPVVLVVGGMALPVFEDRTIRAQVQEGVDLADQYATAIESGWRNTPRGFVEITSDSLGARLPQRGRYVEAIEVVSGMIVITYGGEANDAIADSVLAIVPALDSRRTLGWACGYGRPPAGYEAVYENPGSYTDIEPRYLPSACRSPR